MSMRGQFLRNVEVSVSIKEMIDLQNMKQKSKAYQTSAPRDVDPDS